MTIRRRLASAERKLRLDDSISVPIVWDVRNEEPSRERVEEAVSRGQPFYLVTISLQDVADTAEEAEELLRHHRERIEDRSPIRIVARDSDEILAEWEPERPDWLEQALARANGAA
jgi:hypothetical protein